MNPFVLNKTQIPQVLPIQRGIHLCNETFTDLFRAAYGEDSSILADKCQ